MILVVQPALVPASDLAAGFASQLDPGEVLLLGETHQRSESVALFAEVVDQALERYPCVAVGLEIGDGEQERLDGAMRAGDPVENVLIPPVIDYPAYRDLLQGFQARIAGGACLEVHAIDAGYQEDRDRDEAMASHLAEIAGRGLPVVVLVGSYHALKRLQWDPEVSYPTPPTGEILVRQGIPIISVVQQWTSGSCGAREARWASIGQPDGVDALKRVLGLVKSLPESEPEQAIDGAVLWECPSRWIGGANG